jgi:hypothetical protein
MIVEEAKEQKIADDRHRQREPKDGHFHDSVSPVSRGQAARLGLILR